MTITDNQTAETLGRKSVNPKRVLLTSIVLFVFYMTMAIVVHGVWLGSAYTDLMGNIWRTQPDLMSKAWITQSTTAVFCLVFTYLFAKLSRGGGWKEGASFGFLAYLLSGFQAVTHAYATYPLPLDLTIKWLLSGLAISVCTGILASLIYKKD